MTTINVEFSDSTKTEIIGYASCAQPAATWQFQGAIGTDDTRWSGYYNAQDPVFIRPYIPVPTSS
jgi:hypothetical protein